MALRDYIIATLDPDTDARRRAELQLKTVGIRSKNYHTAMPNNAVPRLKITQIFSVLCSISYKQSRRIKFVSQRLFT